MLFEGLKVQTAFDPKMVQTCRCWSCIDKKVHKSAIKNETVVKCLTTLLHVFLNLRTWIYTFLKRILNISVYKAHPFSVTYSDLESLSHLKLEYNLSNYLPWKLTIKLLGKYLLTYHLVKTLDVLSYGAAAAQPHSAQISHTDELFSTADS